MKDPSVRFRWILLVSSLVTVVYLVVAAASEGYFAEWQRTQREYRSLLETKTTDKLGQEILGNFHDELRQVSIPALGRVDRCVTCHLGIDDPRMTDVRQPFRVHPGKILESHPVDRFGCTMCHLGQGRATTYRDAAHEPIPYWDSPMLTATYLQASCGKCHRDSVPPEAAMLSMGRKLYTEEFACDTCHRINGEGGTDCPELTHVGSKPLAGFDFTHVKGERSRTEWLFEHFKDPQAIIPDSLMPNNELTDEQASALTVFMLSLTDDIPPFDYIPHAAPGAGPESVDTGALFEEKGCLLCHQFAGQGGDLAPDLEYLASQRNADWLFRHFKDPRVPGSKIAPRRLDDNEANELTRYVLSME